MLLLHGYFAVALKLGEEYLCNSSVFGEFKNETTAQRIYKANTNTELPCFYSFFLQGYFVAALTQGAECFCGDSGFDHYGECNNCYWNCTGDASMTCGGRAAFDVYSM